MAFEDNIKIIAPSISEIKDYTPALKIGDKIFVSGIGGDFIPKNRIEGYVAVEENGVLKAQKLSFDGTQASPDGSTEEIGSVGLFNTGMEEPAYKGSTIIKGASVFYKCASVDSTTKTWTGYEAIVNGDTGVWSFSEEATSGLPYNKIIPQVGKVYDEECTFRVSSYDTGLLIPSDGLLFYAPLSTDYKDIVNGYDASEKNGTFAKYNGKQMLYADGSNDVLAKWNGQDNTSFLPVDNAPCSIFSVRLVKNTGYCYIFGFGSLKNNLFCEQRGGYNLMSLTPSENTYYRDETQLLRSVCVTRDSAGAISVYFDGALKATSTDTASYGNTDIFVGVRSNSNFNGYISDFAIYNRALTTDEVLSMHNNLMPQ